MLIDWFTVAAQIVNFLVLVLLLRRFLYGPIIRAMDEREAKIAAEMEEAESARNDATREAESYRAKTRELEERREEMLFQAREDAEERRKELVRQARQEVEELRARWLESLRQEQDEFLQGLRQRVRQQVTNIARRALTDLANVELEQQMVGVFLQRLQALDETAQETWTERARQTDHPLVVRSAFNLPPEMREAIVQAVEKRLSDGIKVRFEQAPEMICGIEAKLDRHKIAWTLEDYLTSLEETLFETVIAEQETPDGGNAHPIDQPAR